MKPGDSKRGIGVPPVLLATLLFLAPAVPAQNLTATPRAIRVVPGELIRVELTVRADSAAPVRFRIPADPLLVLRAVEKLPLQRAPDGAVVHQRVVIWQGLEPGCAQLKTVAVETRGRTLAFPEITITVTDPGP